MKEEIKLEKIDEDILNQISSLENIPKGAFNIRKNGKGLYKKTTENINIVKKEDKEGIDIYVKAGTKGESVHIPVILTFDGLTDVVYNDFHIGENADVEIIAGCGIHSCGNEKSEHNGIHTFYLEKNSKVKYVEKHYGEGDKTVERVLNPVTNVYLKEGSFLEMETTQIRGINSTVRETYGKLDDNTNLVISEKILTHDSQFAKTKFLVDLDGCDSSCKVTSRSVATDSSKQIFESKIFGRNKCFGHVECDAILKDSASVIAIPEITALNVDANLVHEATIGKIAGEQLTKLMTLGLTKEKAENAIINGFLK